MTGSLKLLILSTCVAVAALAIPLSNNNLVWVTDAGYSFLLQVALPHLGIAISGVIGGYAGVLILRDSKDNSLDQLALPIGIIGMTLLIGGLFINALTYVVMYTLVCPPLIGIGLMKLAGYLPILKNRGVGITLIAILLLPSIALLCIGINATDWVIVIDLGTGFRLLFAALIGGFSAITNARTNAKTLSSRA